MATIKHAAYGTLTSALTTELNSLATATWSAASSAIDNTSTLDLVSDFELYVTYGTNPSAGGYCALAVLPAIDGTPTFVDGGGSVAPQNSLIVGVFELRAVTTAQRVGLRDVVIPPGQFKVAVYNAAGQTMASSGNTLKYRTHNLTVA